MNITIIGTCLADITLAENIALGVACEAIDLQRVQKAACQTQIVELDGGRIKRTGSYQDIKSQLASVQPRDQKINPH